MPMEPGMSTASTLRRPATGWSVSAPCSAPASRWCSKRRLSSTPATENYDQRDLRSKLGVPARADHRHRTAVAIVGRVDDELIIERHRRGEHRKRVIGLHDLFETGMRQHAVADQDAQPAVVEKSLMLGGN